MMRDLEAEARAVAHMKAQKAGKAVFAKLKGGRDRMLTDRGAADERAKIVSYLRNCNDYYSQDWANDIEKKEHLK